MEGKDMGTHWINKRDESKGKHTIWGFSVSDGLTMVAEYVKYDDASNYVRTFGFDEPTTKARNTYKRLVAEGFSPGKGEGAP